MNEIVEQVNSGGGSGKPATKKVISAMVKENINPEPQAANVLTPQSTGQKSGNMGFYLMIAGYEYKNCKTNMTGSTRYLTDAFVLLLFPHQVHHLLLLLPVNVRVGRIDSKEWQKIRSLNKVKNCAV